MADTDPIEQPDTSGEVAPEDAAAARQAFLSNPPAQLNPDPEPVIDDEAELLDEPVGAVTPPPPVTDSGTVDPYAEFGGRDRVAGAVELDAALRTESGVRLFARQALEALGYSDAQIRAALEGGPQGTPGAPPAPPAEEDIFDGIADDDLVTGTDLRRIVTAAAEKAAERATTAAQAQIDPVRQQFEQERIRDQSARNDATLVELLGPIPQDPAELAKYQAEAGDVLRTAAKYVDRANFDPAHVRAGIVKAHAEIEDQAKARYDAYIARKREARKASPAHIGGLTGGEGEAPEPKNLKEAQAAARASGLFDSMRSKTLEAIDVGCAWAEDTKDRTERWLKAHVSWAYRSRYHEEQIVLVFSFTGRLREKARRVATEAIGRALDDDELVSRWVHQPEAQIERNGKCPAWLDDLPKTGKIRTPHFDHDEVSRAHSRARRV